MVKIEAEVNENIIKSLISEYLTKRLSQDIKEKDIQILVDANGNIKAKISISKML